MEQLAGIRGYRMNEDPRCCGSGMCIIDTEGRCWCGQQWDGQKMCRAPVAQDESSGRADVAEQPRSLTGAPNSSAA